MESPDAKKESSERKEPQNEREFLMEQLVLLRNKREQMIGDLNAIGGAIQFAEQVLERFEKNGLKIAK